MALPKPVPGLVIRYSYLWLEEHRKGREEGVKDRPAAIVLVVQSADKRETVTVLPVTHAPPADPRPPCHLPHCGEVDPSKRTALWRIGWGAERTDRKFTLLMTLLTLLKSVLALLAALIPCVQVKEHNTVGGALCGWGGKDSTPPSS